jgi:hypothetical protein
VGHTLYSADQIQKTPGRKPASHRPLSRQKAIKSTFMERIDFPAWEYRSQQLTPEEVQQPTRVLHELFDYAHLPELRAVLWEWLKCTVTGGFVETMDLQQRNSILFLYEHMQKLIEAAHLIHLQQQAIEEQRQELKRHVF